MRLLTVEGVYKNGRRELSECPEHVAEALRVLVTFLPSARSSEKPIVNNGENREILRQQAFARMREGIHLGSPPYPNRWEFYHRIEQ
jgi:hypothetical protein